MTFSSIVRKFREEKNLGVRALSEIAQVNPSTVSRLEGGALTPTLETALRISNILEIPRLDLYGAITNSSNFLRSDEGLNPKDIDFDTIPTLTTINAFMAFSHRDSEAARVFVAKWLNKICAVSTPEILRAEVEFFRSEDFDKLFFDVPIFDFTIQYPSDIDPATLLKIYRRNGVIIRQDVYAYVRSKLFSEGGPKLSKEEKSPLITVLNQLANFDSMRNINLDNLIKLDTLYGEEGEIAIMCWKAAEFEYLIRLKGAMIGATKVLTGGINDCKLSYILILISRWTENLRIPTPNWIAEINHPVTEDFPSNLSSR